MVKQTSLQGKKNHLCYLQKIPKGVYKEGLMFSFFKGNSISTSELQKKLASKPEVIDVREKTEFSLGHIPGAKNIPLSKVSFYTKKDKEPVYIICQSGMRSRQAVKQLKNKGIEAVNVKGGMNAWHGAIRGGKL